MKADAMPMSQLFQVEKQFFAPLFQRPYVWAKDAQWQPLWDDIRTIAEKLIAAKNETEEASVKPHFLGAVVLEQFPVPTKKPDARQIIDGQQRLTTLQVLLESFRDLLKGRMEHERAAKRLEKLIYNELQEGDDRFKVWPTNTDRDAYRAVMSCNSPSELGSRLKEIGRGSDTQIARAYEFFYKTLGAWLRLDEADAERRVEALVAAAWDKLHLVVIDMDHGDDAQMIFETLNGRMTPLLPSDLVKNFLFRQAAAGLASDEIVALHTRYWSPFESDDRFWRGEVGRGITKRPRIDIFLQHYLTLGLNDEVASKTLFDEYKKYYASRAESGVSFHLRELRTYGDLFKRLKTTLDEKSAEGRFLDRLEIMEANTVYPFLLGLYRETGDEPGATAERDRILRDVESFLVRRMICRLSTRGYNRLFLDLLQHMRQDGAFTHQGLRKFLLAQNAEAGRWPDDAEFGRKWEETEIYNAISRERVKMLLRALDRQMQTGKTEEYNLKKGVNIEHILPQQWEAHWPLTRRADETDSSYAARHENRNHFLHTVGNLTLLTAKLNSAVSNGPFKRKKDEILRHSAINLNRAFLMDADDWGEEEIRKRTARLFVQARVLWPHPGGKIPAAP